VKTRTRATAAAISRAEAIAQTAQRGLFATAMLAVWDHGDPSAGLVTGAAARNA